LVTLQFNNEEYLFLNSGIIDVAKLRAWHIHDAFLGGSSLSRPGHFQL